MGDDGMKFLPRDEKFYDLFEKGAAQVVQGAVQLEELLKNFEDIQVKTKRIKATEHEGDVITHDTIENLNRTFITPLDREDIHDLITAIDDVLDYIEACAERLYLFKIEKMTEEAIRICGVLVKAVKELEQAVSNLRRLKDADSILKHCAEIDRLENEGDYLNRAAVAKLFEPGNNPLEVIKWKEIYETMENAIDRCEDVANVLEGIALKNT
jgi:predicted phosphate transport protein (TIGR00153 family)